MLFKIDFNDGTVLDFAEYDSLDDAKDVAAHMVYKNFTGEDITIIDEMNRIVANARWCDYPPDEDDNDFILFMVGGHFYEMWDDDKAEYELELEEMKYCF